MTYCELKSWSYRNLLSDLWWIRVDGAPLPAASDLAYALELKCERPDADVTVRNVGTGGDDDWTELELADAALQA